MKNIFKKGLLIGGLLAAISLIGLTTTKKGKEIGEELQSDLKSLAKKLKTYIKDWNDITKEKFMEVVKKLVTEYLKDHPKLENAKDTLIEALQDKWEEVEEGFENKENEDTGEDELKKKKK